jgi:hypothetical protein
VFAGSPQAGSRISFASDGSGYRGAGVNGRCWCITRVVTGWRLEFRDPGDDEPTYAGIFGSVERAMQEASRDRSRPRFTRG